jgi:DNA polymerase-3 subunit alpha
MPAGCASKCAHRTSTTSHLEFTVEGDAIRFGLLAVKNVGQGAIESIIAAARRGGDFRSLTDFWHADRPAPGQPKVLEALTRWRAEHVRASCQACCWVSTDADRRSAERRSAIDHPVRPSLFDMGAGGRDGLRTASASGRPRAR